MKPTTYPADSTFSLWVGVLALLLITCCRGCSADLPNYRAMPDWHVRRHCYAFSHDFTDACNRSGTPAVRLTYDWRTASGQGDRHCVVLFKRDGKLWLMDNEHDKPWGPVRGATDLAILRRHAHGTREMINNVTLMPRPPQTLEQLFPQPINIDK